MYDVCKYVAIWLYVCIYIVYVLCMYICGYMVICRYIYLVICIYIHMHIYQQMS